MAKVLTGKVISVKMQGTAVVQVTRFVPHPLYKKLLKRSKNFKVDSKGHELMLGQEVKIVETKPVAKDKHFKILLETSKEKAVKEESKK